MKHYTLCLFAMILFLSCHKDSDEVITIIENPDPPTAYITTRLVSIVDFGSQQSTSGTLTFAGKNEILDDFAFVQIQNSGINRDYELIQLTTPENLHVYKVASLIENDVNYTHLTIPDLITYDGSSTDDASFVISADEQLIIPAGSLLDNAGNPFQGNYKVHFSNIHPQGNNASAIPSYTGITEKNKVASLLFESCYFITALSASNEVLTFGEGAHITTAMVNAPKWHFDADHAIWVSETNSTSNASDKIELSSAGYYAVAEEKNMTLVKGVLLINGSPSPHYPITITYENQERTIHTSNTGSWSIQLPSSTLYQTRIVFPCGEESIIAHETTDAVEMSATLDITNDQIENVRLIGTARDCGFSPLPNHFTIIAGDIHKVLYSAQPEIDFRIPVCQNGALLISSLNPADGQSGPEVTWKAVDTVNIQSSLACEQAKSEYLSLEVSGDTKMYWRLESEMDGGLLIIKDDGTESDLEFEVFVEGFSEGKYADNMLNILFEDMHLGNRGYSLYCPTATLGCGFTGFTITHFPQASGQWIRGYFEGTFWIKTFNPLTAGYRPVKGEFQVYREF